jgi:surfactin synthase thioesterase subunit
MFEPTTSQSPYMVAIPDSAARLRVFCFHEGGATAASYARWPGAFGRDILVVPIQLPGHGNRAREPRAPDRETLLGELNAHLGPALTAPYVLYGQCAGAVLAHSFARLRMNNGERMPESLIVGAVKAPHLSDEWIAEMIAWPDEALAKFLVECRTISPIVARHPKWLESALALARHYGNLIQDYHCPTSEPLSCSIHGFFGTTDDTVKDTDMQEWAKHTQAEFSTHMVPGSHLFNVEMPEEFVTELGDLLIRQARNRV